MPSCPRAEIVPEGAMGIYHVWARCVRRAFLCGIDPLTGNDYNHRREWILHFQQRLASLTAVEIGFHAELANDRVNYECCLFLLHKLCVC